MADNIAGLWSHAGYPICVQEWLSIIDPLFCIKRNEVVVIDENWIVVGCREVLAIYEYLPRPRPEKIFRVVLSLLHLRVV